MAEALSLENASRFRIASDEVVTLLLVDGVHMGTLEMVDFAKALGNPWHAIHVGVNPQKSETTLKKWQQYVGEGELVIIPSPYRHLLAPIREYVVDLLQANPRVIVHIVMGHLAMDSVFTQVLHQNSSLILNLGLTGLERVVVTIVPVQIYHDDTGESVNQNMMTGDSLKKARQDRSARTQATHQATAREQLAAHQATIKEKADEQVEES